MIDALLSVLKLIDAPGSIPFLLIGVAASLALTFVWPRNRRLGRICFIALVTFYFTLALPIVARLISSSLPSVPSVPVPRVGSLDTVIVFDGDNRRGRVAVTRELFTSSQPREIWVLGLEGDWIRDALSSVGIPAGSIHTDFGTGTTRLQLDWVAERLKRDPGDRLAIVASRLQVPRIAGMARAMHLEVPIISAPVDDEPPVTGPRAFLPTYLALRVSRDALYEHAAVVYYRSQGWVVP